MNHISFNPKFTRKRHTRRPAFGIATDYRIYQDDTPDPDIRFVSVSFVTLISLMASLLGKKAVIKLGAILQRHFTASLRADVFEILYERQLLRERYPRELSASYLSQIADNALPVRVYRINHRRITRRCTGTLLATGNGYRVITGTDFDLLPCRFAVTEVGNLFAAPDWLGKQIIIAVH